MDNSVSLNSINFTHKLLCFNSQFWSRLYAHSLTREFVRYLTKKHTVFRVIIKVTEKLVISRQQIYDN